MTRRPTCADVLGGDPRCTNEPNHAGAHSDGTRFWLYQNEPEPFVAEWVRRARENRLVSKDNTGAVLGGGPVL